MGENKEDKSSKPSSVLDRVASLEGKKGDGASKSYPSKKGSSGGPRVSENAKSAAANKPPAKQTPSSSPQPVKQQLSSPQAAKQQPSSPQAAKQQLSSPQAAKQQLSSPQAAKQQLSSPQAAKQQPSSSQAAKQHLSSPQTGKTPQYNTSVKRDKAENDQKSRVNALLELDDEQLSKWITSPKAEFNADIEMLRKEGVAEDRLKDIQNLRKALNSQKFWKKSSKWLWRFAMVLTIGLTVGGFFGADFVLFGGAMTATGAAFAVANPALASGIGIAVASAIGAAVNYAPNIFIKFGRHFVNKRTDALKDLVAQQYDASARRNGNKALLENEDGTQRNTHSAVCLLERSNSCSLSGGSFRISDKLRRLSSFNKKESGSADTVLAALVRDAIKKPSVRSIGYKSESDSSRKTHSNTSTPIKSYLGADNKQSSEEQKVSEKGFLEKLRKKRNRKG